MKRPTSLTPEDNIETPDFYEVFPVSIDRPASKPTELSSVERTTLIMLIIALLGTILVGLLLAQGIAMLQNSSGSSVVQTTP